MAIKIRQIYISCLYLFIVKLYDPSSVSLRNMIQHQFEQFRNDLVKISDTISFHESIMQHVAIKLLEKEMSRETLRSSNSGLIWKKF